MTTNTQQSTNYANSSNAAPTSANVSSSSSTGEPTRDDAILTVSRVLHRHILHSRAEFEAKEYARRNRSMNRTPNIGSGSGSASGNVSNYGSTQSTPSINAFHRLHRSGSSTPGGNGNGSGSVSGGSSFSLSSPPSVLTSCLNSPAIGSPFTSLATPPQMPLDVQARPHRFEQDVFDIDHYLARSYAVKVPLITRLIPFSSYEQKRHYHFVPTPTVAHIHKFIKRLFDQAPLNAECVIIALIYIERLMETRSLVLTARNWIPLVTTSLLIASKVQDDNSSFMNGEFADILTIFTLRQLNDMERVFLSTLSYELYIASSVYAQYYFGLKNLKGVRDTTTIPRYYHAHTNVGVGTATASAGNVASSPSSHPLKSSSATALPTSGPPSESMATEVATGVP